MAMLARHMRVAAGAVAPAVADGAAAARGFSSKRRTRHNGDTEASRRRADKLFSALRVKQQEQLRRLREELNHEEREALATRHRELQQRQQHQQRRSGRKRESPMPDVAATVAAAAPDPTGHGAWSAAVTSTLSSPSRKELREFERMIARKAERRARVRDLPLFREDSPLRWRFGDQSLGDFEGLPSVTFEGDIAVIHSAEEERQHAAYLLSQPIVGVDTESMPRMDHRKRLNPVCLVQLATLERAFLYRLPRGAQLPPTLRGLLENPAVVKIGHSLDDDVRLLERSGLVSSVPTTLDTLPLATKLGCLRPGLQTLGQVFLGKSISKEMQVSNWEAPVLSDDQIRYAATDAWAPLRVMLEMAQLDESPRLLRVKNFQANGATNTLSEFPKQILTLLQEHTLLMKASGCI